MISDAFYIRATILIGLVETLNNDRTLIEALLTAAGIPTNALSFPDSLISTLGLMTLLENGSKEAAKPNFGLEWAQNAANDFSQSGPLLLIGYASKTIGEWLYSGLEYWALHTNGFSYEIILPQSGEATGTMRLVTSAIRYQPRQWVEMTMAYTSLMGEKVADDRAHHPICVRFQHSRPDDIHLHENLFQCPIEFNAPHNELVYPISALMRPIPGGMDRFYTQLARNVRHRINCLPVYDNSIETTVAQTILSLTGTGFVSAAIVAQSLDISAKTLNRRLQQEGTSFSKILDQCRLRSAEQLLVGSKVPVGTTAGLLDYSGNAQFTTAFKRWKGMSPRAFRNSVQ